MRWVKKQQALKQILKEILTRGILPRHCYLAGGTAVNFYLNHRISIDLDFFSPYPFAGELIMHEMRQTFSTIEMELLEQHSIIIYLTHEKIKFSLFYLPYPLLEDVLIFDLEGQIKCPLASLKDLEAMKAIAIVQRGTAKDFVDLYHLLIKTGHSFSELLKNVIKKYSLEKRYEYHLKTSLIYFDDADNGIENILLLKKQSIAQPISKNKWQTIKRFFIKYSI